MIRLIAEDITSYTYTVVALCGEISKNLLVDNCIKEPRYMRETIKKCVDKKLLVERKTDHGKIIRLSHKGYTALSHIPALKHHYETLTDKHTFKNSPVVHSRRSAAAYTILTAMRYGLGINNMVLTYEGSRGRKSKSHIDESKAEIGKRMFTGIEHLFVFYETEGDNKVTMDYPSFVKRIPANHINLFTSGKVKQSGLTVESDLKAIRRSRSKGHIFGGHTGYAVYAMPTTIMSTSETDENAYGRYLSNVHRAACGRPPLPATETNAYNGNAIVLCDNESLVQEIIVEASKQFTLHRTFAHTYIVPVHSNNLSLITKDDWRENLLDGLYDAKELSFKKTEGFPSCCNAAVGGLPSIDMYAFDVNNILKTFNVIKTHGGIHVICSEWQKPILERVYKEYEKKVVIETVD